MILTGVTLTGADDTVEPKQILHLSERFPFVEWGLLIGSNGRFFRPRFPSEDWFKRLADVAADLECRPKLSLHICGDPLRQLLSGRRPPLPDLLEWDRCQLNFHGEQVMLRQAHHLAQAMLNDWISDEIIVQLDGLNDWIVDALKSEGFTRVSGLYDRSHGGGVVPGSWPVPNPNWDVGYAGGLGPENVNRELDRIAEAAGSQRFWIDMETKLRSDGNEGEHFDPWLCQCVLEYCERYFPARMVS